MRYLYLILKFVLFYMSNWGIWEFIRKKTKVNVHFLPIICCTSQILVLFICGLLNCLKYGAVIIYGTGLLYAIYLFYKEKTNAIKPYLTAGYLFLCVFFAICIFALRGKVLTEYDDFTHWGMMAREILYINQYPTFKNPVIWLQTYPPGTATYIYYYSFFTENTESIWLLAQTYITLTCILCIFAFLNKNYIFWIIPIFVLANHILVVSGIYDLLVDTVLPMVGIAGLLFLIYEYNEGENKKKPYILLFTVPFTASVVLIKNSGLLFAVFICAGIVLLLMKDRKLSLKPEKEPCKVVSGLLALAAPFITFFLWNRHFKYVFDDASSTKMAMTSGYYKSIVTEKTIEEISGILKEIFIKAFTEVKCIHYFACIIILSMMVIYISRKTNNTLKMLLVTCIIYIIYTIGLAGMYVFSMPRTESVKIRSFDRYQTTVLVYILFAWFAYVAGVLSNMEKKHLLIISISLYASLMLVWRTVYPEFSVFFKHSEWNVERYAFENMKTQYNINPDESYMVFIPRDIDIGYIGFLSRYIFHSADVSVVWTNDTTLIKDDFNISDPSSGSAITEIRESEDFGDYKYYIFYDVDNEFMWKWVKETYPTQYGNTVIIAE